MLIDYLTLRIPYRWMHPEQVLQCQQLSDWIIRVNPLTGDIRYKISAWESVRSDSHQIAARAGIDCLYIQGSPARAMGTGDAVFGDPDHALDIIQCAHAMCVQVAGAVGFIPNWWQAEVRRVDVTDNLLLEGLPQVKQALSYLRNTEGGRYRVSQTAGDTVYWSQKSELKSGKAYAKGPHLRQMVQRYGYSGCIYTDEQIQAADCILRPELSLRSKYWRERAYKRWFEYTAQDLQAEHKDYFDRMLSKDAEILNGKLSMNDEKLKERVIAVAPTPGQGRAAWATWLLIQSQGWQVVKDTLAHNTFYRHVRILRDAGLNDLDISNGKVVSITTKPIVMHSVSSWAELMATKRAAA